MRQGTAARFYPRQTRIHQATWCGELSKMTGLFHQFIAQSLLSALWNSSLYDLCTGFKVAFLWRATHLNRLNRRLIRQLERIFTMRSKSDLQQFLKFSWQLPSLWMCIVIHYCWLGIEEDLKLPPRTHAVVNLQLHFKQEVDADGTCW